MRHIAQKNHMTVVSFGGESDAEIDLEPATPFTKLVDAYADRMALYDMVLKNNVRIWQSVMGLNLLLKYRYESKNYQRDDFVCPCSQGRVDIQNFYLEK